MNNKIMYMGAVAVAAVAGCSSPGNQVVTGRVATETFPSAVVAARVVRSGDVVMESALAADGGFSLSLPAGQSYRIVFQTAANEPGLIFPRAASSTVDA